MQGARVSASSQCIQSREMDVPIFTWLRVKFRLYVLLCVVIAITALPVFADTVQTVEMKLAGQDGNKDHGYGNSQWLFPHVKCQEDNVELPRFVSEKPVFYAAKFGDGEDQTFTFVVDEKDGTGTGYDVVYIDGNNDNRLDPETERFEIELNTKTTVSPIRVRLMVTCGEKTLPYFADFSAFLYHNRDHPIENVHATLRDSSYYEGEAVFGGKRHKIAVVDLNSNGRFNDFGPSFFKCDRVLVDRNDDGTFSGFDDGEKNESFPYTRYTQINDRWYSIAATPDGSQVTIEEAHPAMGIVHIPFARRAKLRTPTQLLDLEFEDGKAEAIVGKYDLYYLEIGLPAPGAEDARLVTHFSDEKPQVHVIRGAPAQLEFGPPFRVGIEIQPNAGGNSVEIGMQITGKKNETYRFNGVGSGLNVGAPAMLIVDDQGRPIATIHEHVEVGRSTEWRIPMSLDGKFRIWPIIHLPGLEYKALGLEVEFRQGKRVE